MEDSEREEELKVPTEEDVELEELKNLDSAITQALEFLGQIYVSLSGFHAVEEFLCEQYAASIRFLLRCLSGSSPHSNSKSPSHKHLTSRKSPARNSFRQSVPKSLRIPMQQRNSRSTHSQIDQTTLCEGCSDSDDRLKTIESLCESIDSVLSKAKRVREKCTTANVRRKAGISRHSIHPKSTGKGDLMSVTTSEDARAATKSVTNKNKIFTVAKADERAKKLVSRESTKVTGKTPKSRKPSPRAVEARNELGNITKGVMSQSAKECQPPDTNINTAERNNNGFANESPAAGKKACGRSRLQFPEKLCNLLDWFKSRGISLEDPLNIPRAEAHAAKEDFLSILDEVNNQQDYSENKESREAAARIEETQSILKQLASHVSPFEMSWLLRTAPAGSIAEQRDIGIQNVLRTQLQQGASAPDPRRCHVNYSRVLTPLHHQIRTLSWLPQNCWPYFGRALESLKHGDNKDLDIAQMVQRTFTCYTNPEHVLVMARLWHVIQMTMFQCYLEDVVAAPLLPTKPPRNELSLVDLFRYRLAHSILCKEGRGLMVMAERLVTPY